MNLIKCKACDKYVRGGGLHECVSIDAHQVDYYKVGGIETIDFIQAKLNKEEYKGFLKGNVIKYVSRAAHKGDEKGDYKKAVYYLNKLIDMYNICDAEDCYQEIIFIQNDWEYGLRIELCDCHYELWKKNKLFKLK